MTQKAESYLSSSRDDDDMTLAWEGEKQTEDVDAEQAEDGDAVEQTEDGGTEQDDQVDEDPSSITSVNETPPADEHDDETSQDGVYNTYVIGIQPPSEDWTTPDYWNGDGHIEDHLLSQEQNNQRKNPNLL